MIRLPTLTMRPRQAGLSLVELMVALVIGTILMLGVVQVFGASRASYQLSEGMSRAQENARFAIDFLQRDVRMAGHFGCVNDQAHAQNTPSGLTNTLRSTTHPALDFNRSIMAYEAVGTSPHRDSKVIISDSPSPGGTFSPVLPAELDNATSNRIAGSDILSLRFLAPEGVPVTAQGGTVPSPDFQFDAIRWDVLRSGVSTPGLFGVADCLNSTVFQALTVTPGSGSIEFDVGAPLNERPFSVGFTAGQSYLHRAESVVYYVGTNDRGSSSLYRVRFGSNPGGAITSVRDEMVEGVENLQILLGQDRETSPSKAPTGYVDRYSDASVLGDNADQWRRVGSVQLGVLSASPDRAAAPVALAGNELRAIGVTYEVPADGRYRSTYQTTVALRNRLYGN